MAEQKVYIVFVKDGKALLGGNAAITAEMLFPGDDNRKVRTISPAADQPFMMVYAAGLNATIEQVKAISSLAPEIKNQYAWYHPSLIFDAARNYLFDRENLSNDDFAKLTAYAMFEGFPWPARVVSFWERCNFIVGSEYLAHSLYH